MKSCLAALAALSMLLPAGVRADVIQQNQYISSGPGQYGVSIASVTTLTVPAGTLIAEICVEAASARYTTTGTAPTSSTGIPVAAGGCFQLAGGVALTAFKIIGSGATMDVEYFK